MRRVPQRIRETLYPPIYRTIGYIVACILRGGAVWNYHNFKLWERHGYHVVPLHFYFPIPDTRQLEKSYPTKSDAPGIDFRPTAQLKLLQELARFAQEYNELPLEPTQPQTYYLNNSAFWGVDAPVYYSFIRHFQPQRIVEIGAGYSTLLAAQAMQKNGDVRLTTIDPYPLEFIASNLSRIEIIRERVEHIDPELFCQLRCNDILFIDSSHVVRTGGDTCFLVLDVLPRLVEGVLVHVHDIYLPFDYPKELVLGDHMFWTEQYLVQAYLADNNRMEILFANSYMIHEYTEQMRTAFPRVPRFGGSSLWLKRI